MIKLTEEIWTESSPPLPLSSQEIILERETPEEKLGLTLYYSNAPAPPPTHMAEQDEGVGVAEDEGEGVEDYKGVVTEVLVSQIEQGTVASRDGRLRIGDQILQVRGASDRLLFWIPFVVIPLASIGIYFLFVFLSILVVITLRGRYSTNIIIIIIVIYSNDTSY